MIFFKEKFWEFPQYFQISSKISNFQRKILRISKDFIEIFFKFSLNFHSIFKRNFWFCEIHLKIERNWEREKKITKIYRSFDGRVEKSNFGKFWLFLDFFWKINLIFWQLPITNKLLLSKSLVYLLFSGKVFKYGTILVGHHLVDPMNAVRVPPWCGETLMSHFFP